MRGGDEEGRTTLSVMHCAKVISSLNPIADVVGVPATIRGGKFEVNGGSAAATGQGSQALRVGPVRGGG